MPFKKGEIYVQQSSGESVGVLTDQAGIIAKWLEETHEEKPGEQDNTPSFVQYEMVTDDKETPVSISNPRKKFKFTHVDSQAIDKGCLEVYEADMMDGLQKVDPVIAHQDNTGSMACGQDEDMGVNEGIAHGNASKESGEVHDRIDLVDLLGEFLEADKAELEGAQEPSIAQVHGHAQISGGAQMPGTIFKSNTNENLPPNHLLSDNSHGCNLIRDPRSSGPLRIARLNLMAPKPPSHDLPIRQNTTSQPTQGLDPLDNIAEPRWDLNRPVMTANVLWWSNVMGKGQIIERGTGQVRSINWVDLKPVYGALISAVMVQYQYAKSGRFENFWVMRGMGYIRYTSTLIS